MPSPLSGFGPLTGPGSTRRLGTEAGSLRREARKIRRAGGDDRRLLEASALAGLRDGSITSADSNIEEASFNRRAAAGLGAARQGVLREMAGQGGGMSQGSDTNEFVGKPQYVRQGGGTGSAAVPPPTGGGTPPTTGGGTPPTTGGGRSAIPAMLRRPSAEEAASDARRYNARQGALRNVMAVASESGKPRWQVLRDENLIRKAEGKPALSFEDDEFVSESERQKTLVKSNRAKTGALTEAYNLMTHNKTAPYPERVPGLTGDLDAARKKGAAEGAKIALSINRDRARNDARRTLRNL